MRGQSINKYYLRSSVDKSAPTETSSSFAESVTSRTAVPAVADILSPTLWQLQHHRPILPPVERGSESRLCGVLALQGPGCCCCRGTVRLSKPEKSHGFGPAAAWDGSLSLQVWSWRVKNDCSLSQLAGFSLSHPLLSSHTLLPYAPFLLNPSGKWPPCALTSPSRPNVLPQSCMCAGHPTSCVWKMLHLCVSEPVCVLHIPVVGFFGWLCFARCELTRGLEAAEKQHDRWHDWDEGSGGSAKVNWGLAPKARGWPAVGMYTHVTCTWAVTDAHFHSHGRHSRYTRVGKAALSFSPSIHSVLFSDVAEGGMKWRGIEGTGEVNKMG